MRRQKKARGSEIAAPCVSKDGRRSRRLSGMQKHQYTHSNLSIHISFVLHPVM